MKAAKASGLYHDEEHLPGNRCGAWLDHESLVPFFDAFVEICKTAKAEVTHSQ